MIKSYKIKSRKDVPDVVDAIFGVTKDKNGNKVYPDYCWKCKYAKSRYDHSESYCANKKSESYQSRVRSWDTGCKLFLATAK